MAKRDPSSNAEQKTFPPAKKRGKSGSIEIGARIKEARTRLDISGEKLGSYVNVTKGGVSQWEDGSVAVELKHVSTLSMVLGIPVADLVDLPPGFEFLVEQERLLLRKFRLLSPERRESLLLLLPDE